MASKLILHSNHKAMNCIQGQHKLTVSHAKCMKYLQSVCFTIKHKSKKLNQGADAISR